MANVTVSSTLSNIAVTSTPSNITVSEDGIIIANVTSTLTNVSVNNTPFTVSVTPLAAISNTVIRSAISVVNHPNAVGSVGYDANTGIITYNTISGDIWATLSNTSPITFDTITGVIGIDESSLFSGKTTDDLAEGNVNLYYTTDRANTAIGAYQGNINTSGSINTSGNISGFDVTGSNAVITSTVISNTVTTNSVVATGNITGAYIIGDGSLLTGLPPQYSNSNVSAFLSTDYGITEVGVPGNLGGYVKISSGLDVTGQTSSNISYANAYIQNYYDFGNVSGAVTVNIRNGNLQKLRAIGDITEIKFNDLGNIFFEHNTEITLIIEQDDIGQHEYNLANAYYNEYPGYTVYATYLNNNTTPAYDANAKTIVSYIIIGADEGTANRALYGAVSYPGSTTEIDITGNITTTGTVNAGYFIGDGGGLSNIPGHLTNAEVMAYISSNDLTVGGNILPSANSLYTLGDINNRWKDLYLSGTSIYLDDTAISAANGVLSFGGANIAVAGSSSYTTDDLPEGTGNVWFTTDRANSASDVWLTTKTTSDLTEGSNLYYTTDRANTAIDTRVNKAFVDALGVDYNSLANTPVNVSFFTNDAGYLVTANLASLTANVDSVNGLTGVVTLTTDQITEGSNLYFTTDRANSAIGGYQGDINTAGNITAAYFSGDGGGLSNVSATANLALNTTDDLAEGNTNLYFTTDRANTAIDDYVVGSENILVNSGVISLANALANVNSVQAESLNKISLGDGVGGFTFTEALGADQVATDVLNMTGGYGYTKLLPSSAFNQLTSTKLITYSGTSDVNALCFTGNVVSGSATIQLTGMEEYRYVANSTTPPAFLTKPIVGTGNIATLINEIVPGMAPMYHTRALGGLYNNFTYGDGGTEGTQTPFPAGTYITSIDTGNLTVTMNNPATSDFEFSSTQASNFADGNNSFFMNTMRDTETGFLVGILSEYDVYGGARSPASVGPAKLLSTNVYAYPISGPVAGDFTYTVGSSSDYSLDMSESNFSSYYHYTQGKVSLISSENTYFGIKDGLVVGANTLTTTQMFDNGQPGFGISLGYDGIAPYAEEFGLITSAALGSLNPFTPKLQLGNFTDLTRQELGKDYGATELIFRSYDGNLNEPSTGWYARDNQELGKIGWSGFGGGSTPGVPYTPGAYISASAGEDWLNGQVGNKTNMSFVANGRVDTPYSANSRDVFLTYENGGLYLGSNNPDGTRMPVVVGPVAEIYHTVYGKGTQDNWTSETKRNWVEMNSANVTADTGSRLSVTNGGHNGGVYQPAVGDMVIELDRRVGSKARLPDITCGAICAGTYLGAGNGGGTGSFPDADTVGIGLIDTGDNPLANGTPVYFTGSSFFLGQDLIAWTEATNIGYVKRGRYFTSQAYYGIYTDSGLTTPLTWATLTGTSWASRGLITTTPIPIPGPLLEYDITPSHTAKKYSFELSESSDTLELKEDDVNIVSFESGNITATGNIQADYIIAATRFEGDINGAIQAVIWNASGGTLNKGDIVALNGANHGDTPDAVLADSSNASLMPGIGVVKNSIAPNETGEVVTNGKMNFSSHGFTVGASLYVNGSGTFTETQPSGEDQFVQKIATVINSNTINVAGASRINATPNLNEGNIFIGSASNLTVTTSFSDSANTAIGNYTGNFSASNVSLTKFNETVVSLGTLSGDIAANLDVSTGTIFQVTTGGGLTINSLTNAVAGTSATIIITQGATTGTLTSSMKFAGASKTLSTVTGDIDIISVFYDGSTWYATLSTGYA